MKKQKIPLFITFFLIAFFKLSAQVGINTETPNTNSVLDVVSSTKGVLIPRLTNNEATILAGKTPPAGMLIFNTTQNCIQIFKNSAFECLITSSEADRTKDAWIDDSTNSQILLGTKSDGTVRPAGTEFVAKDDGKVGIGTSNPNWELDVQGPQAIGHFKRITPTNSPDNIAPGLLFTRSRGVPTAQSNIVAEDYLGKVQFRGRVGSDVDYSTFAYIANSTTAADGRFGFLKGNGSTREEVFSVLTSSGNVGIGTITPSATLEVNGNVEIATVAPVPNNSNFAPLVWNTATKRVESALSENVKRIVTGVASGATASAFYTLQDSTTAAYEVRVYSNNSCGEAFYDQFFIAGSSSNMWALNYVGGVSGGGSPTTSNPTVTRVNPYTVKVENPSAGCADGGNSTTFNYTLSVNQSTGALNIQNNGNISKEYSINVEKVFD